MFATLTCRYCGNVWRAEMLQRCPKCKDKDIIVTEEKPKIDYYEGSPPFDPCDEPDPFENFWD
jgi:phage FluMu protein Com